MAILTVAPTQYVTSCNKKKTFTSPIGNVKIVRIFSGMANVKKVHQFMKRK